MPRSPLSKPAPSKNLSIPYDLPRVNLTEIFFV